MGRIFAIFNRTKTQRCPANPDRDPDFLENE